MNTPAEIGKRRQRTARRRSLDDNIMQSQQDFTCKKLQARADIDPMISCAGRRNASFADVVLGRREEMLSFCSF
jgi:hypothetical protein